MTPSNNGFGGSASVRGQRLFAQRVSGPATPFAPTGIRSFDLGRPRTRPPQKPSGGLRQLGLTTPSSPRSWPPEVAQEPAGPVRGCTGRLHLEHRTGKGGGNS